MNTKRALALLMTFLMLFSFAACTQTAPAAPGADGSAEGRNGSTDQGAQEVSYDDTIIFGIADSLPGVFHPLLASKTTDQDVNRILFPSLIQPDGNGNIVPYLAESYEVSQDGLTLTFHLYENAVWHDGEPVTADDVAYTMYCIMDPAYTGTSYNKVQPIAGADAYHNGEAETVEGIAVIDEHTIRFTLGETFGPALTFIGYINILPKHIWESIPVAEHANQTELMRNPIGCGPYKAVEYVEGQYLNMAANESYWAGEPRTKNLVIKVVAVDSILAEYSNGTIDVVSVRDLTGDDRATLEGMGYDIVNFANNIYRYIGINLRREVFQDKALREALIYALDRESILTNLLEGNGTVINSPFLPSGWAKEDPSGMNIRNYDVEKAKQILADAGYSDGDGDGVLESPNGTKLSFTYRIPTDSALTEQVALVVQQCWKAIGVEVALEAYEYSELAQIAIFNHDFDFYTLNCQFRDDPDLYSWWHSSNASDEAGVASFNFDGYRSDACDALIMEARGTSDQARRTELYHQLAALINEDAPMIFLYCQDNSYAYPAGMEGFAPYTFNVVYDVNNWAIPAK